jgi:hypothetical protein
VTLHRVATGSFTFEPRLDLIGPAPDAIRFHYALESGVVEGHALNAHLLGSGGEWSTVAGNGHVHVRAKCVLQTTEHSLIFAEYDGTCDIGEDGYEALLDGKAPPNTVMDLSFRFHASSGAFRRLNRLHCFGYGKRDYATSSLDLGLYRFLHENALDGWPPCA